MFVLRSCKFVKKPHSNLIVLLLSAACLVAAVNASGQKTKRPAERSLKATIVAQSTLPLFCWHVCTASLIARLDGDKKSIYAILRVNYMDNRSMPLDGFPIHLVEQAKAWKFKAIVQDSIPLERYWKISEDGEDATERRAVSAWLLLNGAEGEILPFGAVLPTYTVSMDRIKPVR